jgi:hypothetical protein
LEGDANRAKTTERRSRDGTRAAGPREWGAQSTGQRNDQKLTSNPHVAHRQGIGDEAEGTRTADRSSVQQLNL